MTYGGSTLISQAPQARQWTANNSRASRYAPWLSMQPCDVITASGRHGGGAFSAFRMRPIFFSRHHRAPRDPLANRFSHASTRKTVAPTLENSVIAAPWENLFRPDQIINSYRAERLNSGKFNSFQTSRRADRELFRDVEPLCAHHQAKRKISNRNSAPSCTQGVGKFRSLAKVQADFIVPFPAATQPAGLMHLDFRRAGQAAVTL
jgi:hypothetical protein